MSINAFCRRKKFLYLQVNKISESLEQNKSIENDNIQEVSSPMVTHCDINALSNIQEKQDSIPSDEDKNENEESSITSKEQEPNEVSSERNMNKSKEYLDESTTEDYDELPDLESPSKMDNSLKKSSDSTNIKETPTTPSTRRSLRSANHEPSAFEIKKEMVDEVPELLGSAKEEAAAKAIKEEPEEEEVVYCAVCHDGGDLLYCCDRCPKIYHLACYIPPMKEEPPDDWVYIVL